MPASRDDGAGGAAVVAAKSSVVITPSSSAKKRKYLITDPGFGVRYAACLAALAAAIAAASASREATIVITETYDTLQWNLLDAAEGMSLWFLMGMLSSSCCLIQILLGMMSFGCAGFNTYLGPLRPGFLALTTALQAYQLHYVLSKGWAVTAVTASIAGTAALALLPEALELWALRSIRLAGERKQAAASAPERGVLDLALHGMGCVSCVKTVSDKLAGNSAVLRHRVEFEAGRLLVWIADPPGSAEAEAVGAAVIDLLGGAGFETTLTSASSVTSADGESGSGCFAEGAGGGGAETAGAPAAPATQPPTQVPSEPSGDSCASGASGSWLSFVTAGLLASSCCLLQLAINGLSMLGVLHVGCAGFNKVLGPYRTELRVATVCWLAVVWGTTAVAERRAKPGSRRQPAAVWGKLAARTLLTAGLMFLPELLQHGVGHSPGSLERIGATTLALDVTGMGCEACATHVKHVLDSADGVFESLVDFRTGVATLVVGKGIELNLTAALTQLEYDGYSSVPVVNEPPCARIWARNASG